MHIKECVVHQNMPSTVLLSAMSENASECCTEGLNDKEILPYMRWQACVLPRELIWEGVAPPQEKWNDTVWESGLSKKL